MEIGICVNGREEQIKSCLLAEYVEALNLSPRSLVIELNGQIVKQEKWQEVRLAGGDVLELLNFVGGG